MEGSEIKADKSENSNFLACEVHDYHMRNAIHAKGSPFVFFRQTSQHKKFEIYPYTPFSLYIDSVAANYLQSEFLELVHSSELLHS